MSVPPIEAQPKQSDAERPDHEVFVSAMTSNNVLLQTPSPSRKKPRTHAGPCRTSTRRISWPCPPCSTESSNSGPSGPCPPSKARSWPRPPCPTAENFNSGPYVPSPSAERSWPSPPCFTEDFNSGPSGQPCPSMRRSWPSPSCFTPGMKVLTYSFHAVAAQQKTIRDDDVKSPVLNLSW